MKQAGRLVAFIEQSRPTITGPILLHEQSLSEELSNGQLLEDHDFSETTVSGHGLMLFEGWIEVSAAPEPDVAFCGEWRRLTHWEMCRVRDGVPPWTP